MKTLLLCLLIITLPAAEWQLVSGTPLPLPLDALAQSAALRIDTARDAVDERDCWVELRLVAADGRRYAVAEPLRIAAGERRTSGVVRLDAASWSGKDGPLGADAVQAVSSLELEAHGWEGVVTARVSPVPSPTGATTFVIIAQHAGLVNVGPWAEWRIRLAGGFRGEHGEVELADSQGRRWPMFLDQPGAADASGRWRARGPARWVLRLAPAEHPPAPLVLHWRDGSADWQSQPLTLPSAIVAHESLPAISPAAQPVPRAAPWAAQTNGFMDGTWRRIGRTEVPEALAPILAWREAWTGFRGPAAISWIQAAAVDAALAAGVSAIDLLPDGLADEQGPFRFGLSPWTGGDGPWRTARDVWTSDLPWQTWRGQVRGLLARARATPGLRQWTLGMLRSANDDAQRQRLITWASELAGLVATYDRRPLVARHPQLIGFARTDPAGTWFSFADGAAAWSQGPPPLIGPVQVMPTGSDGDGCIAVPFSAGTGVRVAGAQVALDMNLSNLDRLELDVAVDGGGEATLYAWVTDHQHRWWQQRLGSIPGDGGWQTLGIDCSDSAPWSGSGPAAVWSDDVRRRIRAFGLIAYVRGSTPEARLKLDRLCRMGWPAEAAKPALNLTDLQTGPARLDRWQPIAAVFHLDRTAANPYDPDHADVVGVVEGPDGMQVTHPAFWFEPQRLEFDGRNERVVSAGAGSWRWRWTPPVPGAWRWKIVAKVKARETWLTCESDWNTTTVGADRGGMPTVRIDRTDPRWLADANGRFWYPIGINLRSPGDERQDGDLARERAFSPVEQEPQAIRGWNSLDWQRLGTRAYERWFPLMHANGMDWARIWMSPWWCGLEWRRDWDDFGGLTWFSQVNAARMDRVIELAAEHGVYVQVELMNHGMVGEHADKQWRDSPYNRTNGGPCRNVGEWFRSPEVWAIHAKRLRYTLARWGWCSNLAAWSLCSELEFTGTFDHETSRNDRGFSPGLQAWIDKSLAYMKANDPVAERPVTIHWSHPWAGPQHWRTGGLGFNNSNIYTAFQDFDASLRAEEGPRREARSLPNALDAYLNRLFPFDELRRPTLIGEWGGHWETNDPWVLRGELRTGVWLQAVTPYAGNTGFWWWLWLDVADRWEQYGAVARFMQGEDPRGQTWVTIKPEVQGGRLLAMGMSSGTAIRFYLWPRGYDQDARRAGAAIDATVGLRGLAPGSAWRLRRYDCATGVMVAERELSADAEGSLRVPASAVQPDAVFKLDRR